MKKEEYIAELAKAKTSNSDWITGDEIRRAAISVMLKAPNKKRGQYDYSDERITYSWPQIYFEIGKLSAKQDHLNLLDRFESLERDVYNIKSVPKVDNLK